MKTYTKQELIEILDLHKKWLNDEEDGILADLRSADLRSANLRSADLSSANLRFADLSSADLSSADLRSAFGEMEYVKSLQCEKYYISYTSTKLNIGCQSHSILEWQNFNNDTISKMDGGALEWWQKWKPILMQIIEISPALESEIKNENSKEMV